MKLTSIELTNFKAIGEKVVIPVKPITLIFGANSAGKSSILQCLAMLAQSVSSVEFEFPSLDGSGPLVDVGNYLDFVHKHDPRKFFECRFNFHMDADFSFEYLLPDDSDSPRSLTLNSSAKKFMKIMDDFNEASLSFCFTPVSEIDDHMDLFLGGNEKPAFSYSDYNIKPNFDHIFWEKYWNAFKKEIYENIYTSPMEILRKKEIITNGKLYMDSQGSKGVKRLSNQKATLLKKYLAELSIDSLIQICDILLWSETYQELKEELRRGKTEFEIIFNYYNANNIDQSNYLTGFSGFLPTKFARMKPEDFFCEKFLEHLYKAPGYPGYGDSFHPGQLMVLFASHIKPFLASFSFLGPLRKRPERFHVEKDTTNNSMYDDGGNDVLSLAHDDALVNRINRELVHLQTGFQIKIVHLTDKESGTSGVFLLQFINQKTGVAASIKDVGFGYSQILPVIIKCLKPHYGTVGTVVIEQPELHLHPAMQAELGDMFIRGAQTNNHFFIETHSEHLILRLLRRIRETAEGELPENVPPLTPDDIAVLYVQPGENGAQVTHIPVTADGDFAIPWPEGFFPERARELF